MIITLMNGIANHAESDHSGARLIVNKDWRFYDN